MTRLLINYSYEFIEQGRCQNLNRMVTHLNIVYYTVIPVAKREQQIA